MAVGSENRVSWKSVTLAKILGSLCLSSPRLSEGKVVLLLGPKVSSTLREQSCLVRGLAINKADGCFAGDL